MLSLFHMSKYYSIATDYPSCVHVVHTWAPMMHRTCLHNHSSAVTWVPEEPWQPCQKTARGGENDATKVVRQGDKTVGRCDETLTPRFSRKAQAAGAPGFADKAL